MKPMLGLQKVQLYFGIFVAKILGVEGSGSGEVICGEIDPKFVQYFLSE
jgi:hypothetical protein